MNLVNQSAFLKALGWALIDSLWQMGVLWLLYVLLTANGKKFASRQRHTLALFSVAGGTLWFIANLIIKFYEAAGKQVPVAQNDYSFAQIDFVSSLSPIIDSALPILSLFYLAMVGLLFIRLTRQYRNTYKLYTNNLRKAPPQLRVFVKDLAEQMGIKKEVRLWLSGLVDTPLTVGFWKPIILLPVASINQLSIEQAEAIILHELNHISRNDYLINLLIAFVDIVLFFNPLARILTEIVKKERENSCDDMVLQFRYNAGAYANALLLLEKNRPQANLITVAATGKGKKFLLNRVKRILTNEPIITPVNHKMIAYFFSFILLGFIGWYNPGKVIVQTVKQTQQLNPLFASSESEIIFSSPSFQQPLEAFFDDEVQKKSPAEDIQDFELAEQKILNEILNKIEEEKRALQAHEEVEHQLASFASATASERVFSIVEKVPVVPTEAMETSVYPYVPSQSFSYQFVEDTALPKKYIMTYSEVQAKQAMDKALKGLQEIDWLKLEKEIKSSGNKLDIIQLQRELKKAIEEIDWKKINEDIQSSLTVAQEELLEGQEQLRIQLEKYQKERIIKAENLQKAKQTIILDRLREIETKPCEPARKTEIQRKRKVVHI